MAFVRESAFPQTVFGETLFFENSTTGTIKDEKPTIADSEDESQDFLVVHDPIPKYKDDEASPGKKPGRLKRFFSGLKNRQRKVRQNNNPVGVWLEKHRQVTIKNRHAEL